MELFFGAIRFLLHKNYVMLLFSRGCFDVLLHTNYVTLFFDGVKYLKPVTLYILK